jgi:hypothetical protein
VNLCMTMDQCTALSAGTVAINFSMKGNAAAPAGAHITVTEHVDVTALGRQYVLSGGVYTDAEVMPLFSIALCLLCNPLSNNYVNSMWFCCNFRRWKGW